LIMEPKAGRVAIFSSGVENTHFFEQVLSGQRFVLSFWFTCYPEKQFQIFLDGQAHVAFSHKFRDHMNKKQQERKEENQRIREAAEAKKKASMKTKPAAKKAEL
jgi:hypothetical protein